MWKECASDVWHFCRKGSCRYGMFELPQMLQRPQVFVPPRSISHHHSFGPKTRFLSKPQNIEDRVSLGDLFPWQLCSKPGTACEQIPVSHNRTRIQQIVLFFPVCEKTVACNSVSSRAEFNLYITSQFSCKIRKSYYIQNVSKRLLFLSGIRGHARQKWCLNVDRAKEEMAKLPDKG